MEMGVQHAAIITATDKAMRLPVSAYIVYTGLHGVRNDYYNPIIREEAYNIVKKYTKSLSIEDIREHPMIKPYRTYYWRLGIDPTKIRPSHEALLRRVIRTQVFPEINMIVDIANLVSLKHLVPIGVYDVDKLRSPLVVDTAEEGEEFQPVGSRRPWRLPRGAPVLRDAAGIIHVYPSRDSARTSVGPETVNILVLVGGVEGVPRINIYNALKELMAKYTEHCAPQSVGEVRIVEFGGAFS